LVLAVDGAADQNSADVIQAEQSAASGYIWRLDYDGAGHFRIVNDAGGKVLDVPDESAAAGTDLHLWDGNGGEHQAWRVIDIGQGEYRILNKKSGHYLGVSAGSTQPAATIQQQTESGGDEQIWEMAIAQ